MNDFSGISPLSTNDNFKEYLNSINENLLQFEKRVLSTVSTANLSEEDIKAKCLRIANKIRNGYDVSEEELEFLRLNAPDLYAIAMQALLSKSKNSDHLFIPSLSYSAKGEEVMGEVNNW